VSIGAPLGMSLALPLLIQVPTASISLGWPGWLNSFHSTNTAMLPCSGAGMTGHCAPPTGISVGSGSEPNEALRTAHIGLLAGVVSLSLSGFMPGVRPHAEACGPSLLKMP
jgi:hypothetical protein